MNKIDFKQYGRAFLIFLVMLVVANTFVLPYVYKAWYWVKEKTAGGSSAYIGIRVPEDGGDAGTFSIM